MVEASPSGFRIRLADGSEFGPHTMNGIAAWAREGRIPRDAMLIAPDGSATPVTTDPTLAHILQAPPTVSTGIAPTPVVDTYSGIVPYRNKRALAGYYLSIGSLLPLLGLPLGPTAIILGIMGLRTAKREPAAKGTAHAWIAIALGSVGCVINFGCFAPGIIIGLVNAQP